MAWDSPDWGLFNTISPAQPEASSLRPAPGSTAASGPGVCFAPRCRRHRPGPAALCGQRPAPSPPHPGTAGNRCGPGRGTKWRRAGSNPGSAALPELGPAPRGRGEAGGRGRGPGPAGLPPPAPAAAPSPSPPAASARGPAHAWVMQRRRRAGCLRGRAAPQPRDGAGQRRGPS